MGSAVLAFPAALDDATWSSLGVTPEELRLDTTLRAGQSFRWRPTGDDEWTSTLGPTLVSLRQTPSDVLFCDRTPGSTLADRDGLRDRLRDYFQLKVSLGVLYKQWSNVDPHFARLAGAAGLRGIRVLRQDPTEALFAFICSSNNNIRRIEKMVGALCERYGRLVGHHGGHPFHEFPKPAALAGRDVERELREAGFGYRAKYITETARMLQERHSDSPGGPEAWLYGLRDVGYEEARSAIMEFPGVGPKVADCVCLMALDKTAAVPVDTHVWQIAVRDYGFRKMASKSLTTKLYKEVIEFFLDKWGVHCGWAHSVLFTADLGMFTDRRTEIPLRQKRNASRPTPYTTRQ